MGLIGPVLGRKPAEHRSLSSFPSAPIREDAGQACPRLAELAFHLHAVSSSSIPGMPP